MASVADDEADVLHDLVYYAPSTATGTNRPAPGSKAVRERKVLVRASPIHVHARQWEQMSQNPSHSHQAHPHYAAPKFPPSEVVAALADGTKVKRRVPRMRACDEKDEKGEICSGHLKRSFNDPSDVKDRFGSEIYRCERCRTIYLPNLQEKPRTETLAW